MDVEYHYKVLEVLQKNPDVWLLTEQVFRKSGLFERDGYSTANYDKVFRALKYWVKMFQAKERKIGITWEFTYKDVKRPNINMN